MLDILNCFVFLCVASLLSSPPCRFLLWRRPIRAAGRQKKKLHNRLADELVGILRLCAGKLGAPGERNVGGGRSHDAPRNAARHDPGVNHAGISLLTWNFLRGCECLSIYRHLCLVPSTLTLEFLLCLKRCNISFRTSFVFFVLFSVLIPART